MKRLLQGDVCSIVAKPLLFGASTLVLVFFMSDIETVLSLLDEARCRLGCLAAGCVLMLMALRISAVSQSTLCLSGHLQSTE